MLVESRVKFESDRKAVAAPLSQVIGNIQTAIGYGTLRREGGIAVQVIVGDPVCQGDVVETAADGRIGIRFIDGTVFNLSCSTCVVLNEFVCDSTGTSHSALFGVTKGAFAIIAGQAASPAGLRVDTPFGSIRGRAHAGGFGMLSLTALTFSLMSEVRAADPNATFLDDDSITYKDFEHGAFELVTKEAVPRHIIVEDPGVTVVLRPQGSSVSVNQVTNSPARMAELQAAQQEALTTATKGMGTGSSTPPFAEQPSLQPINFIQTDRSPAEQESLTATPLLFVSIPELIFGKIPPPPPILNAVTGPTEIDTVTFDVFTATRGTFEASSATGATLSFGIRGGTAGSTVLDGVAYDVSQAGPYGTLYVDSTTGAYTIVPNSAAINALKAPTTERFVITVSDGTLSASQTLTIAINGTNDAAIISGITAGSVGEAGGVTNATLGTTTASGTLTDTDVDDAPNTFTAVTSPTKSAGGYGTFTMSAAGVWTYTLNNANGAVQALNVGDKLTDSFTVTTVDGTPQVVTVTISGSNDAAIISGTATGSVTEAGTASPGTPTAIGTLTDTDVDNAANAFAAVTSPTASAGGYGTFTMTAAGLWLYTLDNANSAVQALDAGNTLTDTFTVTTIDGTAKVVTVTISGTNDAAIISGTTTGTAIEAGGVANATPGTPTATGILTDTDVDNPPNAFAAVTSPTASAGGYGTFTMTAAGVWTYTLNNANSAVQALNVGNTLTDSFTVTTVDGTAQVVTVTINGSNDAAIISGTTTGSVVEIRGVVNATPGTQTATATLTDTDLDNPPNTFTAVSAPTASAAGYGTFTMTAAGVWTYTLDDTNSAVQALNVGGTLTDTFTVSSIDGTPQVVTITIHGPLVGATGTAPSLTLSESHLTATALDDNIAGSAPNATLTTTSGNFSTAFTSVQGVDGATISYALAIAGGSGTASGLIDSHTGQADVLVLNGNTIEGHVGTTGGTLAFTIQLDPTTGVVTFTEYRAVTQPFGTNPDGGEGVSLTAGIVNLTATITERDGDFQTASIDLGSRLTITDDGPTIGGFDETTIVIVAGDNQPVTATYDGSFGADGDGAMRVAIHDGAVNGYNLATTDLGGGITSVHVTGNGDDYTFYYTTHAVSGGVELDAFFTNTSGTLSDAYFALLINPDGTYTFDIESVGFLQQTTVSGSDFGASGSGQPSLTSPDGHLIITGDFNGAPADVKASSNGIAVGDTGLQMDQQETLLLKFTQEQPNVSFSLTQWQGNGTADVVVKVHDGATDIHDFTINIPKSSVDPRIVVETTSNLALVNTQTFDSATSTYTLYVGSQFDQIGVSYDHAVTGNATFTVNNITYDQRTTLPSTDLLFDVTAVDRDGDSSSASLQVDLLGGTNVASGLALSSTPSADALVGDSGNATLTDPFMATTISGTPQAVTTTNATAIISGTTTGFVLEAGGASPGTPTGTLTDTDKTPNTFTTVSSPTASDRGYGTFTMTAAGVWTYTLDNANILGDALDVGDTLTDTFTLTTVDGTAQVVTSTIHGSSDADPNDFHFLATGTHEISDSAFVDGTSGGDGIEGAGREGQIIYGGAGHDTINGTGNSDIHNATSNGDGGNDTIYGGSDTIDSNNGGDTIIGGFGSDLLTGSNGDDRFVYLSVADSNAAQFDVISDFKSGSDRINLTALGALGLSILALTSTSTSVPAHTIAWLYDSAANETIVYVNPTDHTLSIGDSGLLEIHLQGIATIQASDFIYEPPVVVAGETIDLALAATAENDGALVTTTADVSSGSTVSDSALVADGSGTTTDEYFSFDAARDRFDSIDHARLTSFDEVWTRLTEYTDQDAVIALASGPSIELLRGHATAPTEDNFTFHQMFVPDSAMTIGDGAVMPLNHTFGITVLNAAAELHLVEHGATPDSNGRIVRSHSDGETSFIVMMDKKDHSELKDHSESKNHSESIPTNAGSVHAAGSHGNGSEAAGTLGLGDSFHFKDKISGSEHSDVVDDVGHTPASIGHQDGGGRIVRSHSDGETSFIVTMDKKDHSELKDHSESKNHSESIPTDAGSVQAAGTHGNGSEAAGTLGLGDSFHFKDKISGSELSDVVDLVDVGHTPASIGHHENAAGAHGPSAIADEVPTTELSLLAQDSAHMGSAVGTHLHDLMV